MIRYVFCLLLVTHATIAEESAHNKTITHGDMSSNTTNTLDAIQAENDNGTDFSFNATCTSIECPPLNEPICVKLRYAVKGKFKTVFIVMINRCEMKYVNCYQGIEASEIAMHNCEEKAKNDRINRAVNGTADNNGTVANSVNGTVLHSNKSVARIGDKEKESSEDSLTKSDSKGDSKEKGPAKSNMKPGATVSKEKESDNSEGSDESGDKVTDKYRVTRVRHRRHIPAETEGTIGSFGIKKVRRHSSHRAHKGRRNAKKALPKHKKLGQKKQ